MEVIVLLIVLVVGGLYFIPTIVALMREHPSKGGIIILNIFLGWTLSRMGRKPCLGSLVHRPGVAKLLVSRVQGESGRPTSHRASGPDTTSLSLHCVDTPACHWRQRAAAHRGLRVRHAAARTSPSGGESPPASG